MKVKVTIDGSVREFDLDELFTIDESQLTKHMSEQASMYAYLATVAAEAEHALAAAGISKDRMYAVCDQHYRATLDEEGTKYTENMIRGLILDDDEYNETLEKEAEAKEQWRTIKAIVDAMEQRSSMLISLGAYLRHELSMTGMHIKEQEMDKSVEDVRKTIRTRRLEQ